MTLRIGFQFFWGQAKQREIKTDLHFISYVVPQYLDTTCSEEYVVILLHHHDAILLEIMTLYTFKTIDSNTVIKDIMVK